MGRNYDPDGWGPAGSQIAKYVYDGEHVALAMNNSGQVKNRYLWADQVDLVLADEQVINPGTVGNVRWTTCSGILGPTGTSRSLSRTTTTAGTIRRWGGG